MEQYKNIVKHSHNVWIIQLCESSKPSEAFQKAAFVLGGVANAGFIDCLNEDCNEIHDGTNNTDLKVVFIHSDGVKNDFINNHDFTLIVISAMELIHDKIENQKQNIQHYNIQIVEFLFENI